MHDPAEQVATSEIGFVAQAGAGQKGTWSESEPQAPTFVLWRIQTWGLSWTMPPIGILITARPLARPTN